jgi:hypothetical protein
MERAFFARRFSDLGVIAMVRVRPSEQSQRLGERDALGPMRLDKRSQDIVEKAVFPNHRRLAEFLKGSRLQ